MTLWCVLHASKAIFMQMGYKGKLVFWVIRKKWDVMDFLKNLLTNKKKYYVMGSQKHFFFLLNIVVPYWIWHKGVESWIHLLKMKFGIFYNNFQKKKLKLKIFSIWYEWGCESFFIHFDTYLLILLHFLIHICICLHIY